MVASRDPDQVYETDATVLEDAHHGPELCWRLLLSHPPQCHGIPIVGWDWDAVAEKKSASRTTWGSYHVAGTYDGRAFTLTAPPGPMQPRPVPPRGVAPAATRITTEDLVAAMGDSRAAGVDIVGGSVDEDTGAVNLDVLIDDDVTRRWVDERFGSGVGLTGLLRPC